MHALVWFRHDLRLVDNPALQYAQEHGYQVLPVYIYEQDSAQNAQSWWLHHALKDLGDCIAQRGGTLLCVQGDPLAILPQLQTQYQIDAVFWNRRYDPQGRACDQRIKVHLSSLGTHTACFNAALLFEPWEVLNRAGKPYQVFSPYWRTCLERGLMAVDTTEPDITWMTAKSIATLNQLHLLPQKNWYKKFSNYWVPTRKAGIARFLAFINEPLGDYETQRDRPDKDATSGLSPYLHSGQVSVRELVTKLMSPSWLQQESLEQTLGRRKLFAEFGWREFSHYLIYHQPQCLNEPLQAKFANFPWREHPDDLKAWQSGCTGYPIVDAGLRQLWDSGWMHNRVRMIVASFLVKHLLQPWQLGADWFMHTLVDADIAANTQGWQWTAGCGADAAPFFRIFNPVSQAKKFDPNGDYIKRWLPILKDVPKKYLYEPWLMPEEVQKACQCIIGRDYPRPMIDLAQGRERALNAWQSIR